MSESDNETSSNDMEKPELCDQRRSTLADFRENSFEARYRGIINKQILESSINPDELKRQLSNFIPFGKGLGNNDTIITPRNTLEENDDDCDDDDEEHNNIIVKSNDLLLNDDGCDDIKKELFNRDDFKEEDESENFDDDNDDMTKKNE